MHITSETRRDLGSLLFRAGLLGAALLCFEVGIRLWESGDMVRRDTSIALAMVSYALALGAMLLGTREQVPRRAVWLILIIAIFSVVALGYIHYVDQEQSGTIYTTDLHVFAEYAATLVRLGENPYTYDLYDGHRALRASDFFNTPLIDGDATGKLAYPAMHLLPYVAFQAAGINPQHVYPLFLILTLITLFLAVPHDLRPLILLPVLLVRNYTLYSLGGVSDIMWAFYLVLMVATWERRWLAALAYGLACGAKQTPWLLAPLLAIRLWYEMPGTWRDRARAVLVFGSIACGVFLLPNIPFMLWDFRAWFEGITEPFRSNMIILGQGLASFTLFGRVFFARGFFAVLMVLIYAASIALYWAWGGRWRESLWIVPGLVFWFGHRSLSSYWYYFPLPMILAVLRLPPTAPWTVPRWGRRASLAVGGLAALVLAGGVLWYGIIRESKISLTVHYPIEGGDNIAQLRVTVENRTSETMEPRFSIQTWTDQPIFWNVAEGPLEIEPFSTATFTIETDVERNRFDYKRGAQVIVSDANSYNLRASVIIQGERDARFPDGIANGDWLFWQETRSAPFLWGLMTTPNLDDPLTLVQGGPNEPDTYLRAAIPTQRSDGLWTELRLDTWSAFPDVPVEVWVKPPANANQPPWDVVYGLELLSTFNEQTLWVLFGDEFEVGEFTPGIPYVMVPAPRETWSLQTLNLRELFEAADVPISEPVLMERMGTELPWSMLNFRLLFLARNQPNLPVVAHFGPVHTRDTRPDRDDMVQYALDHPDQAETWRGDLNRRMRNFDVALDHYRAAVEANPASASAYFGLGETYFWLGDLEAAINAYEHAVDNDYYLAGLARKGQGWSQFNLGNYSAARIAFQRAVALIQAKGINETIGYTGSDLADAHYGLGEAQFWLDNYSAAAMAYSNALSTDYPRPGMAQKGIGWAYYKAERYSEASPYFQRAIATMLAGGYSDADLADAYSGYGWCLVQLGDEEARFYFDQALQLVPNFHPALDGMTVVGGD